MGGKIHAYNKITKYAEELARTQKDAGLQDVILQVDEAYWQVVSLTGKKKLADAYVDLLKKMDNDIQQMIKEGVATKADGLSVKVKLNESEMAQTKADNGLRMTKMLLCQLCGLPLDSHLTLADENICTHDKILSTGTLSANVPELVLNRPELKSLDLLTRIYRKKEDVIRSEMLPTLALTANYAISNPNLFNGFEKEFAGMWNVGLMVNVPLFHWGERYNRLNAAKAETRIKKMEMDEMREKMELQINQSLFKVNESEKRLASADKNMKSANENLRYATLGFEEGLIPILHLMEAQAAWLKANSEWIDAQVDARLARAYLKKATGDMNNE
jgi:outer membrane protein TolC